MKISTILATIVIVILVITALVGGVLAYKYVMSEIAEQSITPQTVHLAVPSPAQSSIPSFSFGLDNQGTVLKLLIKNKVDGGVVQEISLPYMNPKYDGSINDVVDDSNDVNFDGYPDLAVTTNMATNLVVSYYLYNPETGIFILDSTLRDLLNPTFDPTFRTIVSEQNLGCAGRDWIIDTYLFNAGKYELAKTVDGSNCCDSNAQATVTELRGGIMQKIGVQVCQ